MTMARKVGIGNVRPRLVRCADGERVDITDALEAERIRLARAQWERETEAQRAERREVMRGWAFLFLCIALAGGAVGMLAAAVLP